LQEYSKARVYLDSGLVFVESSGNAEWIRGVYINLAKAFRGMKDLKSENIFLNKYVLFNDSVFTKEKSKEVSELQIKYETEKKEKEIALLKEKESTSKSLADKRKLYAVIALISSLFLLALLLLFIVRSRSKKKQQELELAKNKAEFEQQALRAQMNPHFIFNALNSIQSYILNNETQFAYDYLAKFSRLIRQVLMNSQRDDITLKDELDLLNIYIDLEHRRFKNRFEYTIDCPDNIPTAEIKIPVMLIQPFVENAIWHGIINLDKGIMGNLSIRFSFENNLLKIAVEDNGVGREAAAVKKVDNEYKSIGMMFTQKRLELLKAAGKQNARIEIIDLKEKNGKVKGTRVEIYLPV